MDPITSGIISGLVVNALTTTAGPVARMVTRGRVRISPRIIQPLNIQTNQLALTLGAELSRLRCSPADRTKLAKFLRTAEAHDYARGILVVMLTKGSAQQDDKFEKQLVALLHLYAEIPRDRANEYAPVVYRVIRDACTEALAAVEKEDQQQLGRFRQLAWQEQKAGYLRKLADRTTFLNQWTPEDIVATYTFAMDYLRQIYNRHRHIVPPYIEEQHRVPIDDIYVGQTFQTLDERYLPFGHRTQSTLLASHARLNLEHVLRRMYRTVVLGDPGAGKSTLAQKILYDLSTDRFAGQQSYSLCVPFLVTLRHYNLHERKHDSSILQYIETQANIDYQVPCPPGAIEYLLTSGHALVIFDGLDELLETHRRRDITARVESFASRFPSTSVLVTSRKVGYKQAPLDQEVFGIFTLEDFQDESISDYARKWFALDERLTEHEHQTITSSFLEDSNSISDLRSNPLLLSLLCNLYRGARSIPRNRADLYEQCALMLFEKWDASRGIMAPGPTKSDAKFALQYLAFWIYTEEGLDSGVPRRRLEAKLAHFLLSTRYEDEERAAEAAQRMVDLWKGRAWVLTDTGSTATDEPLYQFTHRTFLEYFAAAFLARNNPTPAKLWRKLHPRLANQEWDMVAQLAIQMLNYSFAGATDELLSLLLNTATNAGIQQRINLLRFTAYYIDSLVAGPRIWRGATRASIDLFLQGQVIWSTMPDDWEEFTSESLPNDFEEVLGDSFSGGDDLESYEEWEEPDSITVNFDREDTMAPLFNLWQAAEDTGYYVRDEAIQYCRSLIDTSDIRLRSKALTLLLDLHLFDAIGSAQRSGMVLAQATVPKIDENLRRSIARLSRTNLALALAAARSRLISAGDLVSNFGIDALFCRVTHYRYHGEPLFVASVAEQLLRDLVRGEGLQKVLDADAKRWSNARRKWPREIRGLRESCRIISSALEESYHNQPPTKSKLDPVYLFDSSWMVVPTHFSESALYREFVEAEFRDQSRVSLGVFGAEHVLESFPYEVEAFGEELKSKEDLQLREGGSEQYESTEVDEDADEDYEADIELFDDVRDVRDSGTPRWHRDYDPGWLFCGAVLLGFFVEFEEWEFYDQSEDGLVDLKVGFLYPVAPIIMARKISSMIGEATTLLNGYRFKVFNDDQRSILEQWATGRLSLRA